MHLAGLDALLLIHHEEPSKEMRTPKGDRDRMTRSRLDVTATVRDRVIPAYTAFFFYNCSIASFPKDSVQIQP